jgi:GTP-binding protein
MVLEDVQVVERELHAYGHGLAERPRLLVLNKIELLATEELETLVEQLNAQVTAQLADQQSVGVKGADRDGEAGPGVLTVSAATSANLAQLLAAVWRQLGIQA